MIQKLKDFIYVWQHVSAVEKNNNYLLKRNNDLIWQNTNLKETLTKSTRENSRLQSRISLVETDRNATIANQKVDYLTINKLLDQLIKINKSGLKDKSKEQNQIINEIRAITKKELDNATNID